ncbi:catalase family protein [Elioraea rosea]|uniref:catalase family protein n=1 Tax=Elioraea rosea TaxID=2492390 RepID=UPI0013153BFD|nr:catalase family protein [Elioraea rosea]
MTHPETAEGEPFRFAPVAGEAIPEGEPEAIGAVVAAIEAEVRSTAATGPARRDAHPKAHGCVRAEFRVLDGLPVHLRAGVFAEPRCYPAWVRLSNGSETPRNDRRGDGRGLAIKLLGVEGSPSGTQDFLLINHPSFFVRNAIDYIAFQAAKPRWRFFFPGWNPTRFRWRELAVAGAIVRRRVTNPLDIRYWSMTPYLFGDVACKFSARPASPPSRFHGTDGPDFLRRNLSRHLAEAGAAFDFLVQLRGDPDAMPIEDPTVIWSEAASPFIPVARLTIPRQAFETAEQMAFCENLSFTPWHCVPAHRPLGGINRSRLAVYEAISRLRHELNGTVRAEPRQAEPS